MPTTAMSSAMPANPENTSALTRSGERRFGTHLFQRGGALDGLVGRNLADRARDGSAPACADRRAVRTNGVRQIREAGLLEQDIEVTVGCGGDVLIVCIGNDADDSPEVNGHVESVEEHVSVQRVAVRKEPLREAVADNCDGPAPRRSVSVNSRPATSRTPNDGEEVRTTRSGPAREALPRHSAGVYPSAGEVEVDARAVIAGIAPGDKASDGNALDAGNAG